MMTMRTLEQAIDYYAELARDTHHTAAYERYKHGKTETWQEFQEAADEREQLVKWLMELKRYRESVGYSGKLERIK